MNPVCQRVSETRPLDVFVKTLSLDSSCGSPLPTQTLGQVLQYTVVAFLKFRQQCSACRTFGGRDTSGNLFAYTPASHHLLVWDRWFGHAREPHAVVDDRSRPGIGTFSVSPRQFPPKLGLRQSFNRHDVILTTPLFVDGPNVLGGSRCRRIAF